MELGRIEDFPAIGWIESTSVTAAREAFRRRPIDPRDPALSTAVRMALGQIGGWTFEANGRALVGFYY